MGDCTHSKVRWRYQQASWFQIDPTPAELLQDLVVRDGLADHGYPLLKCRSTIREEANRAKEATLPAYPWLEARNITLPSQIKSPSTS